MGSRKSQFVTNTTMVMILLVVVIIVFLIWTNAAGETISDIAGHKMMCQAEILKASTIEKLTNQPNIRCPVGRLVLDGSSGKSNQDILDLMIDAIQVSGEGKLDYPRTYWFPGTSKSSCIIYSNIEFSKAGSEKYKNGETLTNALDQPTTHKTNTTYREYFESLTQGQNPMVIYLNDGEAIDPNRAYTVIIRRYQGPFLLYRVMKGAVQKVYCFGCSARSASGPDTDDSRRISVELIPNEGISDRCQVIMN